MKFYISVVVFTILFVAGVQCSIYSVINKKKMIKFIGDVLCFISLFGLIGTFAFWAIS